MSPIQAALEHCRLKADLDAARADGDGWWIQEAVGALTHFVEERYAPQGTPDNGPCALQPTCVYRKPHPVERESESRKLIG